mgnify:CR=1 FL=1
MDKITIADLINYVILPIGGLVSWFFKTTLNRLQNDIDMIKKEYLHKDDFKEFKVELRAMFEELKKDIRDLHAKN